MGNCVTPYLPKEAVQAIRASSQPTFVKAPEHSQTENGCPNCGGVGAVYVVFTKGGPYQSPPAGGVGTWFDGNGQYGKGWYNVDRTMGYTCPECKGVSQHTGVYVLPPPRGKRMMEKLGDMLGRSSRE